MEKLFELPTELETAEWQMKFAEVYCEILKQKATQEGLMNDKNMLDKIENAERDSELKRQRYENLIACSKGKEEL